VKIELTAEEDARVLALPETKLGMTNFDHSIDPGLDAALREGMKGRHAAWEFNGLVWLDERTGMFCEVVRRYHMVVAAYAAPSLKELMDEVNDEHGWE
jgi:hypothetical protein